MAATISLAVTEGILKGERFVFERPGRYILGRAPCCNPQLPNDLLHGNVSRFHCLFDISPPHLWVRDMGSRNGTFVNGELIGQRQKGQGPEGVGASFPERHLGEGDEVRVGDTVFRVEIRSTAADADGRTEVLDGEPVLMG